MMETMNGIEPIDETKKKNIRHAEKRRTSTCRFADRLAQVSIDTYRKVIPEKDRPPQTCLATVIAHHPSPAAGGDGEGRLMVVGLGVGTKFLSETILRSEASSSEYGRRVRDCHAEVLARRAFRRQLTLEIIDDLRSSTSSSSSTTHEHTHLSLLEREPNNCGGIVTYRLRPGITLHFYSSSAPCGNAVLKKFAKMSKETFQDDLSPDQWPCTAHVPIPDSSIHLGQFSLLIKKDSEMGPMNDDNNNNINSGQSIQGTVVPALQTDDWTPPGTTIVTMHHKGSIHTCSDKLARWNYLGLQGSLLSSLMSDPLYLKSLSVGRKFTECICRRAVCCRMQPSVRKNKRIRTCSHQEVSSPPKEPHCEDSGNPNIVTQYRHNHPAIMGNAIYMDESGVVETSSTVRGQDVRFHSSKAWCWWPSKGKEKDGTDLAECIDGVTGYVWSDLLPDDSNKHDISRVSTFSLVEEFLKANEIIQTQSDGNYKDGQELCSLRNTFGTLGELKTLKLAVAPEYEGMKGTLLSNHPIFRYWRRRS